MRAALIIFEWYTSDSECDILDNAEVQVLILYKTQRPMECSDQLCNDRHDLFDK